MANARYIKLVCDGRRSDQSWSVGVLNGMFPSVTMVTYSAEHLASPKPGTNKN